MRLEENVLPKQLNLRALLEITTELVFMFLEEAFLNGFGHPVEIRTILFKESTARLLT